ncbi:hypothetical protein BDZ89DRAFT_1069646 [Hymenopellis radicata]|nr:hypothetical protein BDZ89DRAFT_1069646 [Hymenopellis radicata]
MNKQRMETPYKSSPVRGSPESSVTMGNTCCSPPLPMLPPSHREWHVPVRFLRDELCTMIRQKDFIIRDLFGILWYLELAVFPSVADDDPSDVRYFYRLRLRTNPSRSWTALCYTRGVETDAETAELILMGLVVSAARCPGEKVEVIKAKKSWEFRDPSGHGVCIDFEPLEKNGWPVMMRQYLGRFIIE